MHYTNRARTDITFLDTLISRALRLSPVSHDDPKRSHVSSCLSLGLALEPGNGAAVLAALVIGPLVLLAGCLVIFRSSRHRADGNKKRSVIQVGTVGGVQVSKGHDNADIHMEARCTKPSS